MTLTSKRAFSELNSSFFLGFDLVSFCYAYFVVKEPEFSIFKGNSVDYGSLGRFSRLICESCKKIEKYFENDNMANYLKMEGELEKILPGEECLFRDLKGKLKEVNGDKELLSGIFRLIVHF